MVNPVWQRLTLRQRTAIIIAVLIWITGLLVGWICRSSFSYLLYRQTDIELKDDANDFLSIVKGQSLPLRPAQMDSWNRRVAIHPLHRLYIRVLDQNQKSLWDSITVPSPLPVGLDPFSTGIQTSGSYRVTHRSIEMELPPTGDVPIDDEPLSRSMQATLQVGCSLQLVESTMAQFDTWLLSALGPLFIIAPMLAWYFASWLLDPLKQLTRETDSIQIGTQRIIRRSNNGDEIDRLAEKLNLLLTRVRSHLRENEDWIADSAHQLRGPLAAIVSNVEVVAGRIPDGKSSLMLQKVLYECEYLKKLVNQLLLLGEAKADRHQTVRQRIAWHQLVSKSSDFFEALANARDIDIQFTQLDPCIVLANPEHLRYLIHNLIDNAIKYTSAGGKILVSIRREDALHTCQLQVEDNGIGISEEDQPKIGRRFFRSNSGRDPEHTPRGSGLGLHIVRSIVDSLNGELRIESQLGIGTTITVILPIEPQLTQSDPPAVVKSRSG